VEDIQMTLTEDEDLARGVAPPSKSVAERLAARLGAVVSARTVFGDPVERDGVTVIPVAKAAWAFGGGGGMRQGEEGSGGGGGAKVTPQGYIEIRGGKARYRRIRARPTWLPVAVAAGVAVVLRRRLRRNVDS
jgi:uncharacterized spore protein YtfJ